MNNCFPMKEHISSARDKPSMPFSFSIARRTDETTLKAEVPRCAACFPLASQYGYFFHFFPFPFAFPAPPAGLATRLGIARYVTGTAATELPVTRCEGTGVYYVYILVLPVSHPGNSILSCQSSFPLGLSSASGRVADEQ